MLSIVITYKDVFPQAKWKTPHVCAIRGRIEYDKRNMWKIEIVLQHNIIVLRVKLSHCKYFLHQSMWDQRSIIWLVDWLIYSNDVVRTMTSSMLQKFDKYWSRCHSVMTTTTIFDPRYKMKILEFYFLIMYRSEASNEIERIHGLCYELLSER